jgi:predicted RNA methylase
MSDTETPDARTFTVSGEVYDRFMGRYSTRLAGPFADAAGIAPGQRVVDVGCGPGALTAELVGRVGAANVAAVDPAPQFVDAVRERLPGVEAKVGRAGSCPTQTRASTPLSHSSCCTSSPMGTRRRARCGASFVRAASSRPAYGTSTAA